MDGNLEYLASNLRESICLTAQALLLAFQHYIVNLGTTVLIASNIVPRMGGDHGDKARVIQVLLFMSGINTLLQTLVGSRLPTVMGASFAYTLPLLSIINDYNDEAFATPHDRFIHSMRTIQGSMIVSSFVNIILGYGRAWGELTSPIVVAPVVCHVGLGNRVEIGLPMLILVVISQKSLKRIHSRAHFILERFDLLFCIRIIWAFAAILTVLGPYNNVKTATKQSCRTDRSYLMSSAPWIKIPYPFQWGTPIFRASHVIGMIGAALVSSAESTGTFFAAAWLSGATAPPAHVLSRSIGLQGIGMLLEGLFGSLVGTTASFENVGLLGLTHIGSRRVASASGITFIQFANINSIRNIYVLGVSLFLRLSIPQYIAMNTAYDGHGPFNDILNTIFSSPATVVIVVGTILNTLEAIEEFHGGNQSSTAKATLEPRSSTAISSD
ncbi:Nucleobase-ascorbate transporter 3 [Hibiscus syriacus]|uniref:Nucleobase-ascorbate transporter 3 n=1 Tax=Hibiscus syriacus TaxID=106335 RepID=A0A6A2XKY2_HIBSY|nr:Nucleobase-ascorbate transporter 3 [Hibiscus syriacus]